jgi:ribonuclease HII
LYVYDVIIRCIITDSKALSEEKRDSMFEVIANEKDRIGYVLATLSAEFISTQMMSRSRTSLNKLSHDAAIALIRKAIDLGVNVTEVRSQDNDSSLQPGSALLVFAPHMRVF